MTVVANVSTAADHLSALHAVRPVVGYERGDAATDHDAEPRQLLVPDDQLLLAGGQHHPFERLLVELEVHGSPPPERRFSAASFVNLEDLVQLERLAVRDPRLPDDEQVFVHLELPAAFEERDNGLPLLEIEEVLRQRIVGTKAVQLRRSTRLRRCEQVAPCGIAIACIDRDVTQRRVRVEDRVAVVPELAMRLGRLDQLARHLNHAVSITSSVRGPCDIDLREEGPLGLQGADAIELENRVTRDLDPLVVARSPHRLLASTPDEGLWAVSRRAG